MRKSIFGIIIQFFFIALLLPALSANAQVVANFTYTISPASGCAPVLVNFTNTSTGGATNYNWSFGNGNNAVNPNPPNPATTYNSAGTYTVTLTASNGGANDVHTVVINAYATPVAAFTINNSTVCLGKTISFTDNSNAGSGNIASWVWDFGDGNGLTNTISGSSSHSYNSTGTFPVSLTVTNNFGCFKSITKPITIVNSPTANFTGTPLTSCSAPLNVTFTNSSITNGGATYNWDFGNGNNSVAASPPVQTYNLLGNYTVSLIVKEQGCSDTLINTNYVVIQNVVPDFSADNTNVCLGQTINFTDLSSPLTASRTWDFGDGQTATTAMPSHTYTSTGTYTVSLLNANGCVNKKVKNNYIKVFPLPVAAFNVSDSVSCTIPFAVNFTDKSIGAVSWNWDFGDGITSTLQNPPHSYTAIGNYNVSLTITDAKGCSNTLTKNNLIKISPTTADFFASPFQGCIPLVVNFTSTSQSLTSPIVSYHWDFGNGVATTASPNKSHLYNANGKYTVKLVVTALSGCKDSITKTNYVKAGTKPTANFSVVDSSICHRNTAQFTDLSIGADSAHWVFSSDTTTFDTPSGAILPFNPVFHFFRDTGVSSIKQVVFNNGCADSIQKINAIYIHPARSLFTYSLNCTNYYSVNFSNKSQGADSIVWDFGDGTPLVSNISNITHTFASEGLKYISLKAFNFTTGCFETNRDSFSIAQPIAKSSIVKDTSCYGIPVSFNNLSQDSKTVLWDFGDGNKSSADSPKHKYSLPGLYTSKLVITDINGCKDSLTKVIDAQGPIPNFTANVMQGCTPFIVTFSDKSVSDSLLTNWSWQFGDGSPVKSVLTPTVSHVYTVPGTYTVKMDVTDKNGCLKTSTKTNYIQPTFPFPSIVADTLACKNQVIFFDASATNVAGPAQFNWNLGDGSTASGTNVSHAYVKDSLYLVQLTVIDKNGCDSILVHPVHIQTPKAMFTYSVISSVCGQSKVQFTDKSVGLSLTNWKWSFGDLGSSIQPNPIHTYTFPGYYSVSLIVTNTAGCFDTVKLDSIFVQGPIGSFSFAPKTGCVPLEVTFTASSKNATSYTWDFGDGVVLPSTDSIVKHTYNQVSMPTPSLQLNNTLKDGSPCTFPAAAAGQITVTSSVNIVIDSLFNVSCFGQSNGRVYSSESGGTLPYTYSWSSIPIQHTSFANGLASGTYTLHVTDANQCNKDTMVTIDAPSQVKTIAGAIDTLCPNSPFLLSASASGGVGNYNYLWQPGGAVNSGSLTVSPASTITYTVTAIDKNNCVGISDTIRAFVYSISPLNIQLSATSPICLGQTSTISAISLGLTGTLTYNWIPFIGSGSGPFIVTPAQPTTYFVTIKNSCDSVLQDSVKVLFTPPPIIKIQTDTNALCFNETFRFNDSSLVGNIADPVTSWMWDFGDSTKSTIKSPAHRYASPGIYNVKLGVKTNGGCINNNSAAPLVLNAYPYPISVFSINKTSLQLPTDTLICDNQSVGAAAYRWDFGDGTEATLKAAKHSYNLAGNFKIQLIAISKFGCMDTSFTYVTTTTKIIFPNAFTPDTKYASGGVYDVKNLDNDVFFPYSAGVVEYDFEIFNRWGELIFVSKNINIGWDGYYRGKLCEQGVYIWKAIGKFNDGTSFNLTGDVTLLWQ
jgi:PKD repeat protein